MFENEGGMELTKTMENFQLGNWFDIKICHGGQLEVLFSAANMQS